jgi:hypothetical protein
VLRAVAEHEQSLQDNEVDALLGLSSVGASSTSSTSSSNGGDDNSEHTAKSLESVAYAAVCALASSSCGYDWRGAVRSEVFVLGLVYCCWLMSTQHLYAFAILDQFSHSASSVTVLHFLRCCPFSLYGPDRSSARARR